MFLGLFGILVVVPATLVAWGLMDGWTRAKRALWKRRRHAFESGEGVRRFAKLQTLIAMAGTAGGVAWHTRHQWFYRYAGGSTAVEIILFVGLCLSLFAAGSMIGATFGTLVIGGNRLLGAAMRLVFRRCARSFTSSGA